MTGVSPCFPEATTTKEVANMAKREYQTGTPFNITTPAVALTEREAAIYLSVSPQFLRLSRHYGNRPRHAEGPPFIRLGGGRAIRYLKADLDEWLGLHRHHPSPLPEDL